MAKQKQQNQTWKVGAIAVAVVAAAALLVLWFYAWAPPTTTDYRLAQKQATLLMDRMMQADTATTEYSEAMANSLRFEPNGSKIASDTAKQKRTYDDSLKDYKDQLAELQTSAAARDQQVKSAIAVVTTDTTEFNMLLVSIVKDYPAFYKTRIACSSVDQLTNGKDTSNTPSLYATAAQGCISSLNKLKTAGLGVFRNYAAKKITATQATQQTYIELAKPGVNKAALTARLTSLKLDALKLDPLTDLQKARDTVMNHEAINKLEQLLKTKYQG